MMKIRKRQSGFSLIEVLVSVVIMSVGILGIAGMQVISLQQNRSSLLRTEALQLGNDILDRMRANPNEDYSGIDFGALPPDNPNCVQAPCTRAQMKAYDITQWQCSINSQISGTICATYGITGTLPGGAGAIINGASDASCDVINEICVVVQWVDNRDGSTASVSLRTRAN